jgi:hypothetical protein
MSNLNGLWGFYHDPNVGVNLPWSGYPGLHLNHGECTSVGAGSPWPVSGYDWEQPGGEKEKLHWGGGWGGWGHKK